MSHRTDSRRIREARPEEDIVPLASSYVLPDGLLVKPHTAGLHSYARGDALLEGRQGLGKGLG